MSEEQKEWEVETILQRGRFNNITHYLVHWRGYPQDEATWQPIINLENCEDAIMKFESQFKDKGKDKISKLKKINKEQRQENQEQEKKESNEDHQLKESFPQTHMAKERGYVRKPPIQNEELNITKESVNSQNMNLHMGNLNQQRLVENPQVCQQLIGDKNTISNRLRNKRIKIENNQQRDRKHDNVAIQNPPRKRIKVNQPAQKDQLAEYNKLKIQNNKIFSRPPSQIKQTQPSQTRYETKPDFLSKITYQNNQIGILKEMFQTLIPSEKEKKTEFSENKNFTEQSSGETKTLEKKKFVPEQHQLIPKELSKTVPVTKNLPSVNPISQTNKVVKTLQVTEQQQKLSINKVSLIKNTSRYEQCDQEHLAQKKTTLRNIIRKNLGLELGKHKVRTLDIADESLLESDLGEVKRFYNETEVDKLELLVKLPYGWVVVGRDKEKELFVVDVNLIKMEYWDVIVSKYLAK